MDIFPIVPLPGFVLRLWADLAAAHHLGAYIGAGTLAFLATFTLILWTPEYKPHDSYAYRRIREAMQMYGIALALLVFGLYAWAVIGVYVGFFLVYAIIRGFAIGLRPERPRPF